MTDNVSYPKIGDRPNLADETMKHEALLRVQNRDTTSPDPTADLYPTMIGEITALLTDSGDDLARYEWKLLAVRNDVGETEYLDAGPVGDDTNMPCLIEVNRLGQGAAATPPGDDPQEPSYKVGDRVLVHRVASDGGDVYMCVTGQPIGTHEDPLLLEMQVAADAHSLVYGPYATTWDIDDQGENDGVSLQIVTRVLTDGGYAAACYRLFTWDSKGALVSIGAEEFNYS